MINTSHFASEFATYQSFVSSFALTYHDNSLIAVYYRFKK